MRRQKWRVFTPGVIGATIVASKGSGAATAMTAQRAQSGALRRGQVERFLATDTTVGVEV